MELTLTFGGAPATGVPGHQIGWVKTDGPGTIGTTPTSTDIVGHTQTSLTGDGTPDYTTVQAWDVTCFDGDGNRPFLGEVEVTFCKLIRLDVAPGLQVGTTNEWVAPIEDGETYVTVTAVVDPAIDEDDADRLISWANGLHSDNPLERLVDQTTPGTHNITCQLSQGGSATVQVTVCEVAGIAVVSGASSVTEGTTHCAVAAADPEDTAGIILQADLNPDVSPVPAGLLVWSGGQTVPGHPDQVKVDKTRPGKIEVTCTCGSSSATITVYVLGLDASVGDVPDEDEDTVAAEVYINTDDDDLSSTSDREETTVTGENDLITSGVKVLPDGLTFGTVSMSHTSGIELWEHDYKGTQSPTSWSSSQHSGGAGAWVEGRTVTEDEDYEEITWGYSWGGVQLSQTVKVQVLARDTNSEMRLKVYNDPDLEPQHEKYDPISDTCYIVLYVKIGQGEKMASSSTSATVQVHDDYGNYEPNTTVDYNFTAADLTSSTGWQQKNAQGQWGDASAAPNAQPDGNLNGSAPLEFRRVYTWNTHKRGQDGQPLGNNGTHIVRTTGQVQFQRWDNDEQEWGQAANGGPSGVNTNVQNLYMKDVTGEKGTIDYFKWDPDSTDNALKHPKIKLNIADTQCHKYRWIMRFRQTIGSGTWDWDAGWWSMKGTYTGAGSQEIILTDPNITGHLDAEVHPWGTYTYDILMLEYFDGDSVPDTQSAARDWNFLKRYSDGNYKLWVPENLPAPNGDEPGHDVWVACPDQGPAGMRAYYCLESTMDLDAEAVDLITIDPTLSERASLSAPTGEPEGHGIEDADQDGEFDGLACYQFQDSDPGGTWRVVVTARDAAGRTSRHWRTHDAVPMLAVNAPAGPPAVCIFRDSSNNFEWASSGNDGAKCYVKWYLHWLPNTSADIRARVWPTPATVNILPLGVNVVLPQDAMNDRTLDAEHLIVLARFVNKPPQFGDDGMTMGGTYNAGAGTKQNPDCCGLYEWAYQQWVQVPPDNETAVVSKILFHEFCHACGVPPGQHHDPSTQTCLVDKAVSKPLFSRWSTTSPWDYPFYLCTTQQTHWKTMVKHVTP